MHTDFILSDILSVIESGIDCVATLPEEIVCYPSVEFILQTLFLRVTGFQEQKLKCVMWQLATHDFDFRYKYLKGEFQLGECSKWSDKKIVFDHLKRQNKKVGVDVIDEDEARDIYSDTVDRYIALFQESVFSVWLPRDYNHFLDMIKDIGDFPPGYIHKGLLGDSVMLRNCFDKAIDHRNKCAHNIGVYRANTPSLNVLRSDKDNLENYFSRLFVIALVDKAFVALYKHYDDRKNLLLIN